MRTIRTTLAAIALAIGFAPAITSAQSATPAPTPPPAAPAPAASLLSVDAKLSTVSYRMVHKLHKFEGVSRKVEGRARVLPSGQAQLQVRAPVESFDSGNVNRDAHMKETIEAARYPLVEVAATLDGLSAPTTFPSTVEKIAKAQVTFHGVKQAIDVPVKITWEAADRVRAAAKFALSLESFKVERPSLLFVKVDDAMEIDTTLVFTRTN